MLLFFSVSNHKLHLVLGFSNSGSFWLVLVSSQLLCWYHSVSYCLFGLLITLTILHSFHVFFSLSHMLLQNCVLSSAFSYTIHLLISSFLSLDGSSVDFILVYALISLHLCLFCMELLFQLFYHRSYPFFFKLYFLWSSSYFSFLLISSLSDVLRCLSVSWLHLSFF